MTDVPLQPLTVRIRDACRMTGIGRSKLYELIADGEIEILKVGAITLVPVAGLQAFLERNRGER
jgi:excisionase family DNA binding protein